MPRNPGVYSQNTSYFSLPLPLWQQPLSYRSAKYEKLKQRGRYRGIHDAHQNEGDSEDDDNDRIKTDQSVDEFASNRLSWDHHGGSEPSKQKQQRKDRKQKGKLKRSRSRSRSQPARSRSPLILSPGEAHQYRIAGLPVHHELPEGNFPHAAPPETYNISSSGEDEIEDEEDINDDDDAENQEDLCSKKVLNNRQRMEKELAQLNPPLYLAGGNPTKKNTLRFRHLAVITTILHRCLMEQDYIRAGRAWGLILRDEFGGHPIDVRAGGRWGIGAEILLWQDQDFSQDNGIGETEIRQRKWFTRIGFEKAKEYYERLILQYPYRKTSPNALSPLQFYPAMFGLWISLVQEESRKKREQAMDDEDNASFRDQNDDHEDRMSTRSDRMAENPDHDRWQDPKTKILTDARTRELEEAQQIASQMDNLLASPPFSDDHQLLNLRAMVSQWIGDLYVFSVCPRDGDDDSTSENGYENEDRMKTEEGPLEPRLKRLEVQSAKERRSSENMKANTFMERAKARRQLLASSGSLKRNTDQI
ncbi:hypothetical protein FQN57_005986 [Myotisia sp. PD_48]|nr:hypothetical protein FQN57_005986 [Myotisia sp. PD_48]